MSYRPVTDVWILARPKVRFYGAFPSGFLSRARALLGVGHNDAVLHVCAGKVRDYPFDGFGPNDKTVDLDPDTKPDFLMDVREIGARPGDIFPWRDSEDKDPGPRLVGENGWSPYGKNFFPAVLIDRPYTEEDSKQYSPVVHGKLPNLNDLLKRCLTLVPEGGKVGVLDYFVPRPPKNGVRFTALVSVLCGFGNRLRAYSVFERQVTKTEEQKRRVAAAIRGKV